jgi:hypothetical protein
MSDEIRSTAPRARFRYVLDLGGGHRWMVEEREFHGDRCLFFSHDGGFVRQRNFPPDWFDLTDAEILALLPGVGSAPNDQSASRQCQRQDGFAFS